MIFGGLFDFDKKEEEIKKLEEITKESNFWDDVSLANKKITELNNLKKEINNICSLKEKINNNLEILSLLKNENDEELQKLVEEDIEGAYEYLEKCEVEPDESLLNLYASYDLIGYFQLVDHYSKKVSYQVSGGIRWEKKCGLSSHY